VFFACNLRKKPYIPFATEVLHSALEVLQMMLQITKCDVLYPMGKTLGERR
jgi:hypothetical protein